MKRTLLLPAIVLGLAVISFSEPVSGQTHGVHGTVTDPRGNPVENTRIVAHRDGDYWNWQAGAWTDDTGHYFLGLPQGEYGLSARPPRSSMFVHNIYGLGSACIDDELLPTIHVEGRVTGVDIQLEEGGKLAFTLLDSEGMPITARGSFVFHPNPDDHCYVWEDVNIIDGRYESTALVEGTHRAAFYGIDLRRYWNDQLVCGPSPNTPSANTVVAGETNDLGYCIVGDSLFRVSGQVTGPEDIGLPAATVAAHPDGDWFEISTSATTDDGGWYTVEVPLGRYAFSAVSGGGEDHAAGIYPEGKSCVPGTWPTVMVEGDADGINISLGSGGKVAVRLEEADGTFFEGEVRTVLAGLDETGCYTWFVPHESAVVDGKYTSPVVPTGQAILHYRTPDQPEYRDSYYCDGRFALDARTIEVPSEGIRNLAACALPQAACEDLTMVLPGDTPLDLVRIPHGAFMMGAPDDWSESDARERPQHEVRLTRDYYLGRFELRQDQWLAVAGDYPSNFHEDPRMLEGMWGLGRPYPLYMVSWPDMAGPGGYLTKLNRRLRNSGQPWSGLVRLPTEAEWERAVRAGTETRYFWNEAPECNAESCDYCAIHDPFMLWCGNRVYWGLEPVGRRRPNGFGLFNTLGNVREWVEDCFYSYNSMNQTNPSHPSCGAGDRTLRGGCFDTWALGSRVTTRFQRDPRDNTHPEFGFRLAMSWPLSNDELAPPAGAFRVTTAQELTNEHDELVTIWVTRSGGSAGPVSVDYRTTNGTAESGTDYRRKTGTISWGDGEWGTKTIEIPVLADEQFEATEDFAVVLENPTGGAFVCDAYVRAFIADASRRQPPAPRRGSGRMVP